MEPSYPAAERSVTRHAAAAREDPMIYMGDALNYTRGDAMNYKRD